MIFGTIEDFYMYWHLEFLIFIFIQEYFDAHVVRHIFLGRPSGKKVVSGHSWPRDARISFRSTSPSIFCRKLNFFLIPHSTIRGIFKHVYFASHDLFLVSLKSVLFY